MIPGTGSLDLPRKPEEIRRAWAAYQASACQVKTDGARLEVTFPGLDMGIFSGDLRFTVYRGTNLLRQEAIAKTEEKSVAYKYDGRAEGLRHRTTTRASSGATRRAPGRSTISAATSTRTRSRSRRATALAIVESRRRLAGLLPAFAQILLRARDRDQSRLRLLSQDERQTRSRWASARPTTKSPTSPTASPTKSGTSARHEARHDINNFALYNAPPGHLAAHARLLLPERRQTAARPTSAVLAFTHDDVYKPMPGYKVMVSHFHMHFNEQLTDAGTHRPAAHLGATSFAAWASTSPTWPISTPTRTPRIPAPSASRSRRSISTAAAASPTGNFLLIPGEEPDDTWAATTSR